MDTEQLQSLVKTGKKQPLWTPEAHHSVSLRRPEVERMLPHRPPFLLVDEITAVDLGHGLAQATRRIDPADPIFGGHFPEEPVYPGVLQLEIMGQAGVCLMHLMDAQSVEVASEVRPRRVRILKVHYAAFFAEVLPGDEVTALCKSVVNGGLTTIMASQLMRGGTICSLAVAEVYLVDE